MKYLGLAALAFTLLVLGSAVNQASASDMVVHAGFAFVAGGVTLPAGEYRIESYQENQVTIRNADTGKGIILPVLARLNERENYGATAIFKTDGTQYFLSEVYLPGMDGFQLKAVSKKDEVARTASASR